MLYSFWAWNVICAPDVFTWNFAFMLLNMAQVFHLVYQLRPVKFDPELEEAYHALFEPFKVRFPFLCRKFTYSFIHCRLSISLETTIILVHN